MMKTIFNFTFVAVLACLILAGCTKTAETSATAEAETATAVNEPLKTTLAAYFQLKDALVNDDAAQAKEKATALADATGSYGDQLNEYALAIGETDDIEAQREAFEALSIALYDLAKEGGAGITVYKQYCPMAFDDKGAFWLSNEKQVLNPYFGASMLRCGMVQEEIN
jgi:outer membrane murein-binding lipoprotein Lpp